MMYSVEIYDRDNHEIGAATLNFDDLTQFLTARDNWKTLYFVIKSVNI